MVAASARPARGMLVLVVGPSGAGKDSLIAGARVVLAGEPEFLFARRFITRQADAGGEDHLAVTKAEFARRRAGAGFLLSWQAHGLEYGIAAELEAALASGRTVIANVSRAVIDEARARYRPVMVLEVTAPREVLAARLAARGREDMADIAARLDRAEASRPAGPDVVTLVNDGALAPAVARFVAIVRGTRAQAPPPNS